LLTTLTGAVIASAAPVTVLAVIGYGIFKLFDWPRGVPLPLAPFRDSKEIRAGASG